MGSREVGKFKGRKGFGIAVKGKRASPGNASVKKLFSDERFHEAILDFLRNTSVGRVKKGVLVGRS